jgi:hypothetical protein
VDESVTEARTGRSQKRADFLESVQTKENQCRPRKIGVAFSFVTTTEAKVEGTKYGPIFLVCVIVGSILVFVPPSGFVAGGQLVYYGMQGLLVEQQIEKRAIEFKRETYLRELDEKYRQAEFDREMQRLRLQRPATPDEGY